MKPNREQTMKALECCGRKGSPDCDNCPMEEGKGCAVRLYREALDHMKSQETAYNELYEVCDNYRHELGELRGALSGMNRLTENKK